MILKKQVKFLNYFANSQIAIDGEGREEFKIEDINKFIVLVKSKSLDHLKEIFDINDNIAHKIHDLFNCNYEIEMKQYIGLFLALFDFAFMREPIFFYEFLFEFQSLENSDDNRRKFAIQTVLRMVQNSIDRNFIFRCSSYQMFLSVFQKISFFLFSSKDQINFHCSSSIYLLTLFYGKDDFSITKFQSRISQLDEEFKKLDDFNYGNYILAHPFEDSDHFNKFKNDFKLVEERIKIYNSDENSVLTSKSWWL